MSQVDVCLECGTRLSAATVEGLCPKCLARMTLPPSLRQGSSKRRARQRSGPRRLGKFGDYELFEEIGRGGMGAVYKGRQQSLNRLVAVKVILSGRFASPEAIQRFRAEAEAAANLQHPNIVAIHEVGEHEGQHYFSMDYVDGPSLAEVVRETPLTPRRAAVYVERVAAAIEYAHQKGTIHRDLKPSNVLIDRSDEPRIADFGLAKRVAVDLDLTATGQVIGSPNFLAPEQARGGAAQVGPACDIYALGALLYFLLTGRPPFLSESLEETLRLVVNTDPISPRLLNPAVPRDLETIGLKCLEKEAPRRYRSAKEVADELGRFLRNEPIHARPLSRGEKLWRWCRRRPVTVTLSAAVVVLFLAGFGGVSWQWRQARQNARAEAHQRERLEETLSQLELQRAEDLFRAGDSSSGLAYLARVLRRNPTNRIAAERLFSTLSHRSFALPALKPFAHEAAVTDGEFSPDGRWIITSTQDGTLKLWGGQTSKLTTFWKAHSAAINFARFSPDGHKIATASQDRTARVWDLTGSALTEPLRHDGEVGLAEWSPDGSKIVTASNDGTARVWDAQTGRPLIEPLRHQSRVSFVQFSASGRWIVTASWEEGVAQVWSAESGQAIGPPLKHPYLLHSACWSPDESRLVTACYDGKARLWAVPSGQLLAKPLVHENVVEFAAFSPVGDRVVSVSRDHTARLWDVASGEPLATLKHAAVVRGAGFSADGQRLLTVASDNTASVWDVHSGQLLVEPIKHGGRLATARFSPTGQQIVTACADKTARLWDIRPGQMLGPTVRHSDGVVYAKFSPTGDRVVTASLDSTARIALAQTGEALGKPIAHANWVSTAVFSPDGKRVLTASADGTARICDGRSGEDALPPLRHGARITVAQFSADGRRIVLGGWDASASIWDAHTGERLVNLSPHAGRIWDAQFSSDGRYVVTDSMDEGTARLWDARNGRALAPPLRHEGWVGCCRFSPDSRRVITASGDHTARIWEVPTGRLIAEPIRHLAEVSFCEFSPDGQRVVTASHDNTARVWDGLSGKPLTPPMRHEREVTCARFNPDGTRIVTASVDSTARIWDAATGRPLSEPLRHRNTVNFVEFSPDGKRVVTASSDGTARIWELALISGPAPPWLPRLAEAVARQQLTEDDSFASTDGAYLFTLKSELESRAQADASARWAKWFFSDRSERTVSVDSPLSISAYIQRKIADNSLDSLREALRLSPTNGVALARLARLLARSDSYLRQTNQADAYSRGATEWSPDEVESWWVRAEVLEGRGELSQAVDAMERGSERNPQDPAFWNAKGRLLDRTDQLEGACAAYAKAIELSTARNDLPLRTKSLMTRHYLLLRLNRPAEAQADWPVANNIPARDARAGPRLIDLSLYYNAALDDDWHGRMWKGNNLATLPTGRQTLGGVEFDIRGIVQLASPLINQSAPGYPEEIKGIPIRLRCQRLHFLHATGWGNYVSLNARTGTYRLRYRDGQAIDIPILNGEDSREWQVTPNQPGDLKGATVVWEGKNARGVDFQLFKKTWNNPRPEMEIASMDFISAGTGAAPFLIAITAEP